MVKSQHRSLTQAHHTLLGASMSVDGRAWKKQRTEQEREREYTQGPLDEVFGQHSAFPVQEDESSDVYMYLNSVRQQAEADRCIYYVEKRTPEQDRVAEKEDTGADRAAQLVHIQPGPQANELQVWNEAMYNTFTTVKSEIATHTEVIRAKTNISGPLPQTASAWRNYVFVEERQPSLDLLFNHIDHSTTIKLVIYCTQWLSGNIPTNLSRWIYMLFLRLENVLDHTEIPIVRDLAKKAIKLKVKGNLTNISEYTVDMVIYIVGSYYRQRDLLDA